MTTLRHSTNKNPNGFVSLNKNIILKSELIWFPIVVNVLTRSNPLNAKQLFSLIMAYTYFVNIKTY